MPSGTGSASAAGESPASATPALAKAKSGRIALGHRRVEVLLEPLERRLRSVSVPAHRHEQAERHAGERGVDSGLEHREPENEASST